MKRGSRISNALHVLVHLAQAERVPVTSEHLSACLMTNPVVIRRDMAALRQAGVVTSTPGHGGGWTLTRAPEAITLREVYSALAERLVSMPAPDAESPGCVLEARVHRALGDVFQEIEVLLEARLARITLADLVKDLPKHGFRPSQRTTEEVSHGV